MSLTPGSRLGPYEILASIGAGGMGEVFRAHDTKLNRDVAIKILVNRDGGDAAAASRFEREAQAVAALNHPGIVTIHAIEEIDGLTFLVMELIEGRTLAHSIPADGLPLGTVLNYGLQLADALAAAHAQGITHRDLKPANVMLSSSGRLKVLDFGLAKLKEQVAAHEVTVANPTITGAGQIVGTVAYMSPEQASGAALDHRTDLFSLGVLLYELATGQRPFKGESSVTLLASILKDTPQPVTEVKPELPREFSRIIRRALAKDPEARYQTAKDLRNDLLELKDDVASGEVSGNRAAAAAAVPPRRSRAWPLAAAAMILLGAIAAGIYLSQRREEPVAEMAVTRLTSTGHASRAVISPDGKYVVHVVSDGRNSLWVRQTATGSNVQIVPPADDRFMGLTFSPDGNYVYYTVREDRTIANVYRIPILGGTPEPVLSDVDSAVAFSPDGSQFAFLRGFPRELKVRLYVTSADGSAPPRAVAESSFDGLQLFTAVSWSPDGRTIAVPYGGFSVTGRFMPASIALVDVASGTTRHLAAGRWLNITALQWMSAESLVVAAVEPGKLNGQLWSVRGETVRRLTNDPNNYTGTSAASAVATLVTILGNLESGLSIATLSAGGAPAVARITAPSVRFDGQFGLAWTSDGRLVYTSASSGQPDLWISNADGTDARQLTRDASLESSPAVSPDDRSILYKVEDGGLLRYNVAEGRSTRLTSDAGDDNPAWSPDGKQIFFTRVHGDVPRQFRMNADGTAVTDIGESGFGGRFSPDATQLAAVAVLNGRASVALHPTDGGRPTRGFDIVSVPVILAWTPASDAITFLESRQGPQTIWNQPLDGSAPKQLLGMGNDQIFNFAWSKDGRLAISHGPAPTDVVMLTNVR